MWMWNVFSVKRTNHYRKATQTQWSNVLEVCNGILFETYTGDNHMVSMSESLEKQLDKAVIVGAKSDVLMFRIGSYPTNGDRNDTCLQSSWKPGGFCNFCLMSVTTGTQDSWSISTFEVPWKLSTHPTSLLESVWINHSARSLSSSPPPTIFRTNPRVFDKNTLICISDSECQHSQHRLRLQVLGYYLD